MNDNLKAEATNVVQRHKESVEYFLKFGDSLERAIAKVFLEAAEGKLWGEEKSQKQLKIEFCLHS